MVAHIVGVVAQIEGFDRCFGGVPIRVDPNERGVFSKVDTKFFKFFCSRRETVALLLVCLLLCVFYLLP